VIFDVHATLALANPTMPMCDGRWIILALGNFFLPEVQFIDSLPLGEFFLLPRLDSVHAPSGSVLTTPVRNYPS
jgi:hypothetical protein